MKESAQTRLHDRLEVEAFLYLEARLADESVYEQWLALWDREALYWVPCSSTQVDADLQVSIIYDNRRKIEERIQRLMSGKVPSQTPPSQMRRLLANIEVEAETPEIVTARANFHLTELRNHDIRFWVGRTDYRLRLVSNDAPRYRMLLKKVILVNSEEPLPSMTFLI